MVARRLLHGMCATGLMICIVPSATAYEVRTHQKLTLRAVEQSVLADATQGPLAALGIADLGEKFRSIPSSGVGEIVSAAGLVGLGAIYEDDLPRFVRHFYDPQQGGDGLGLAWSSKQWVLEAEGDIPEQQFSLRDAHQFYLNALTHGDLQIREQNSIQLLQTMGRAVHHLQDMSQPAHVRGDAHPLGLDGDRYEAYTDTQFVANRRDLPAPLPCGEGPIDLHEFDAADKFWSHSGRGVAEFTSSNFVSADTNFRGDPGTTVPDPDHPLPAFPASPVYESALVPQLGLFGPATTRMDFLGLPIVDAITEGGCFNSRAVAQSFVGVANVLFPRYSLNSVTFEANYPILFPRAINYSVGMINYFFRGRLRMESYSVAGNSVQIVVRNVSAAEFALAEMPGTSGEEFSVYYDAANGERRRLALQGDDLEGDVLAHGETASFSFALPPDLDTTLDHPFVLVFNGRVGNERGIAAIPIGPPQDGAFLVTPNYPPIDGVGGSRVIAAEDGEWRLSEQAGAVAGNIDWRGHHPEDVLTWHGPQGRHFGSPRPGKSPNIYRGGKVLTVAPGTVIGAAVTVRGARRHLIAAVSGSMGVTIYRRPYQLSYEKDGLYDPLNNPLGWKAIHSFTDSPVAPMFFNASGTEAQVFVAAPYRLKVNIAGETVTQTQIENRGHYRSHRTWSQTPQVNLQVNPGPPRYCESENYECVGGRGQCTLPDGGVMTNVCLAAQATENTTYGFSGASTSSGETIQAAVVCADYQGDLEVLCTVELDEDMGMRAYTHSGERSSTRVRIVNQSTCGNEYSGPQLFRNQYQHEEENHAVMRFRVGAHSIPLSGSGWRKQFDFSTGVSWEFPAARPLPSVNYTYEHIDWRRDSRLLYVDARYDIVAYEDYASYDTSAGAGATNVQTNPVTYNLYMLLDTPRVRRRESKVVVLADREYVLSTHVEQGQPEYSTPVVDPEFHAPGDVSCTMGQPVGGQEQSAYNHDISGFYEGSVHPRILGQVEQLSFNALSQGVFVASVPIWLRQADGTYVQEGTWNHLSNGDLSTLLPSNSPPQTPSYVPTGIVK